MYQEEKIINGILCFRNTPRGEFIPLTPEQLTKRIQLSEIEKGLMYSRHEVIQLINKIDRDGSTDDYSEFGKPYVIQWINTNLTK